MKTPHQFLFPLLAFGILSVSGSEPGQIELVRVPEDGIQPQAAVDRRGALHLIYYKGSAEKGDIFYVRRQPGETAFSKPLQVNHEPGSAIAAGTIRGAQLAMGRDERVHVAWNGHAPKDGDYMKAPMFYTRLNDERTGFEAERDVITRARGLDGGGSVAADRAGNVYVVWHAPAPGNTNGEAGRGVFVARSSNDGKSFAPEVQANPKPTGACGCCGLKAFADSAGNVLVVYRSAFESTNRDENLLISRNQGADFEIAYTHGWKVPTCPMSSAFISQCDLGILAAAETHGRVFFVRFDPRTGKVSEPVSPAVKGKHPVAVANQQGQTLLVWAEGTAWAKGGTVAWQLFDKNGTDLPEHGHADGLPTWSLAAAVAKPEGGFAIFY